MNNSTDDKYRKYREKLGNKNLLEYLFAFMHNKLVEKNSSFSFALFCIISTLYANMYISDKEMRMQ